MKTNWDYSSVALTYAKRPAYCSEGIKKMLQAMGLLHGGLVCDIGAGTGHLTVELLAYPLNIVAVEPNHAMRAQGIERTRGVSKVQWVAGTGENTGQAAHSFDLATFGSSFNVVDQGKALQEVRRILKPHGWFACMWNHRDLDDPIQSKIEQAIQSVIPDYDYGLRRQNQTDVLQQSNMFMEIHSREYKTLHRQSIDDCYEAWQSHATLQRQAKHNFGKVLTSIRSILDGLGASHIEIPYHTRIWYAQLR